MRLVVFLQILEIYCSWLLVNSRLDIKQSQETQPPSKRMTPSPTHTRSVNKRLLSAQGYYQGEHLLWLPKAEGHELYRLMSKNYSKQGTRSWPQQNKSLKGQIWNSKALLHTSPMATLKFLKYSRNIPSWCLVVMNAWKCAGQEASYRHTHRSSTLEFWHSIYPYRCKAH